MADVKVVIPLEGTLTHNNDLKKFVNGSVNNIPRKITTSGNIFFNSQNLIGFFMSVVHVFGI